MASHSTTGPFPGSHPRAVRETGWEAFGVLERIAAGGLFAATLPVLAVCAVIVRALSGRPPFIAHRRVGRYGRVLWVYKLRTMWDDRRHSGWGGGLIERVSDDAGPLKKSGDDARITSRFARLCRRYSVDEVPQLLQVATGEMALAGPRPLTRAELVEHYGGDMEEVLRVKPGITGLWQVLGRSSLTYAQRRRLDLFFVRRRTPGLYARILLLTLPAVFGGRHAV